jgi:hypothetical protein
MAKHIKILVVPINEDNGIDQSSTVEEILACKDTIVYDSPAHVFQDLNDEEINDDYWYFLVDMKEKMHLNTR